MMKKPTYEQALESLKQTVEKLESGSATLDESIKLYEKGMELSALCVGYLENAKQKILSIQEVKAEAEVDE